MSWIRPEDWRPRGIEDLEPQAWRALRHPGSSCVVAGPGAGKTEFLAQRAVFLLETGLCRPPYRILAISFKTDAAKNLAARVRQRCPPELANRFVSLTFDAFTKSLVDRFHSAIPQDWRPTRPYEIAFPSRADVEALLDRTRLDAPVEWQAAIAAVQPGTFEAHQVGAARLPPEHVPPRSAVAYAIDHWWNEHLRTRPHSAVTFVSINRLAELLLRTNAHIGRALRSTYPFVFIDEFQDTTYAQYDFLLSAFARTPAVMTAVGDDKQRIMVWAGARLDAFRQFERDFGAARISLHFNFRSSPDLVRIQHVVAQALDPDAAPTVAQALRQVDGDVAQVWSSHRKAVEARYLAQWLTDDMHTRGTGPRDYALLVRQRADTYEADLAPAFADANLRIRNESRALGRTTLQDLLADDLARIALAVLRLGAQRRAPEAWQRATSAVEALRAVDPDDQVAGQRAETELTDFLVDLRTLMAGLEPNVDNAATLAARVFGFLDLVAVARGYVEYSTGDYLDIIVDAFGIHLAACTENADDWVSCCDAFEGTTQIPLMTVHKSKGLEYDTIIFIGLDDRAWWSYAADNPEGMATFFVALSRAKQRAIFAFCQERGQRRRIAALYQLLTDAGVPEIPI